MAVVDEQRGGEQGDLAVAADDDDAGHASTLSEPSPRDIRSQSKEQSVVSSIGRTTDCSFDWVVVVSRCCCRRGR